jgi:signal peptidase I
MRGLDLGAHSIAEAPLRPARRTYPGRHRRRRRLFFQWIVVVTVAAIAALALRASIIQPFAVPSASMVPTLQVGDRILVLKSHVLSSAINTGDIVVLRQPKASSCGPGTTGSQDLVTRVIGLPGETIWSVGDTIYTNRGRLKEAGWYNPPFGQLGPTPIVRTRIPAGSYFVLGDNRTDTCDSRRFGPIRGSLIVGKVVATILRDGHPHVRFS